MAAVQLPLSVSSAGPTSIKEIEQSLWEAVDQLRANSKLKSSKYSVPVPTSDTILELAPTACSLLQPARLDVFGARVARR